jgi:hypothetical protein
VYFMSEEMDLNSMCVLIEDSTLQQMYFINKLCDKIRLKGQLPY